MPIADFLRSATRKLAGIPGRLIPYAAQRPVLSLTLNRAFRKPLRRGDLGFMQGARIRVRVTDLNVDWVVRVDSDRLVPIGRDLQEDVRISGESPDFLSLATRVADPDTLFFQRRLRIEGDTELGLGVKNTMDGMAWEDLPQPLRSLLRLGGAVLNLAGGGRRP